MSEDSIIFEGEWSPWPEDLDPVKAADQLTTSTLGDPHDSLIQLLRTVPTVIGSAPVRIREGSRMAEDGDAVPGLLNLPMLCHNYLAGSADFFKGLYRIMRPRPKALEIPRFSAYPLLRGVIESSGQTAWVLGTSERRDRFQRLLQLEKAEMDYDRRYVKSATVLHDDYTRERRSHMNEILRKAESERRIRWKQLCNAAAALGIDETEFEQGVPGGYESIISESAYESHLSDGEHTPVECHWISRYYASIWVFISGLSHPSVSRAWAGSLHGPGETGADGYTRVKTSANPELIRDALLMALRLHMRALRLWAEASGVRWSDAIFG
ncbi:hypothetical protein [Mycobacterium montefiorense]|uniref:Uncharacterized protein n=1 Tax=Mycobacterium montefiorense TaxID=154654 RepID=A0AA37UXE5_9MYCO|nr:hypothetical protein [Mycobacterium montefiorense]GBG39669.1 hypothetical protein MmonteBS_40410 [Mycobacterium montefiorense]GKU35540.1 hypothetical protein NJB14191_28860 [Mycobacterium montefiorense]GKU40545.1 hypothetical protein NJB14192_25320 [Mycobacterium montefiorense]GKU45048.1 hypothetical protein NJB14194_16720 [Mycobacterium montefiorense]GKU51198.1 hypothetical protein NJB14195_24440 [Mycobacterium montefiorense]